MTLARCLLDHVATLKDPPPHKSDNVYVLSLLYIRVCVHTNTYTYTQTVISLAFTWNNGNARAALVNASCLHVGGGGDHGDPTGVPDGVETFPVWRSKIFR